MKIMNEADVILLGIHELMQGIWISCEGWINFNITPGQGGTLI